MYGIASFQAVINPPQAGILAVGEVAQRPVVRGPGRIEVAEVMRLNLACDHRVINGADRAVLLARISEILERPVALAL